MFLKTITSKLHSFQKWRNEFLEEVRRTDTLITPCKHSATRGMMVTPHTKVLRRSTTIRLCRCTPTEYSERMYVIYPALRLSAYTGLSTLYAFGVTSKHKTNTSSYN